MPDCPVILLIGRRRSGKTVTTLNLMRHYANKVKFCVAMVGSNSTINDLKTHMPSTFIYDDVDFDVLQKLIDKQNAVARTRKPDRILLVIDDLAYGAFFKASQIKQLVCNGRHLGITLIITTQYLRVCPPIFRANVDIVMAAQEKSTAYRKALYENFSICFKTWYDFDRTYRELTTGYAMMVLVTASGNPSDLVPDNVFWIKSPFPTPPFHINPNGRWWELHKARVDPLGSFSSKPGEIQRVTLAEQRSVRTPAKPARVLEKKEEKKENEFVISLVNSSNISVKTRSRFS